MFVFFTSVSNYLVSVNVRLSARTLVEEQFGEIVFVDGFIRLT